MNCQVGDFPPNRALVHNAEVLDHRSLLPRLGLACHQRR